MDKQEIIRKKILSRSDLERMVTYWHFKGMKITAAFGTFDIMHPGVIELITHAKKHGDALVVGIRNDDTIKKEKGSRYPLVNQELRAFNIASLQVVANVYILESEDPAEFIDIVKPKEVVCCVHSPEKDRQTVEQALKSCHGKLLIHEPTVSWDSLVDKICQK